MPVRQRLPDLHLRCQTRVLTAQRTSEHGHPRTSHVNVQNRTLDIPFTGQGTAVHALARIWHSHDTFLSLTLHIQSVSTTQKLPLQSNQSSFPYSQPTAPSLPLGQLAAGLQRLFFPALLQSVSPHTEASVSSFKWEQDPVIPLLWLLGSWNKTETPSQGARSPTGAVYLSLACVVHRPVSYLPWSPLGLSTQQGPGTLRAQGTHLSGWTDDVAAE